MTKATFPVSSCTYTGSRRNSVSASFHLFCTFCRRLLTPLLHRQFHLYFTASAESLSLAVCLSLSPSPSVSLSPSGCRCLAAVNTRNKMTRAAHPLPSLPKGPPATNGVASARQVWRRAFMPPLPGVLTATSISAVSVSGESLLNVQDREMNAPFTVSAEDAQLLRGLFPKTIDTPFLKLVSGSGGSGDTQKPIKVGVVLSGGQAAGGHNVICGVFDFIQRQNPSSVLYGFLGGPHGVFTGKYLVLTKEKIDQYRNMGGFDMIKSGRHKIETDAQKQASLEVCKTLQLDGLVVIGGDDSNTNAAILAEFFKAHGSSTQVVGCPKTIDGDLKNYYVEVSFGFDTACRTYSCGIGNLMTQTLTQRDTYQFVRLMGRSASLLTLECALRCHPNLTFIGEEVLAKKLSLKHLVAMTADLVQQRAKYGKFYGVILLPEGLIEFIPEVGVLILEINHIVAAGKFDKEKLTPASRAVLVMLPTHTQQQLLLDRDPHGNVQVALIHTEQLLLELTEKELQSRGFQSKFAGRCTYLGYEGRSGFPSDFDASYCYGLGTVAGALIRNKSTSCMAVLKGMSCSSNISTWQPAGVPLTQMMNLETRKGKSKVPVIKKFLVDLERPLFKAFEKVRDAWKILDVYRVPGPMQLDEEFPQLPYTLTGPPPLEKLLPPAAAAAAKDVEQLQRGPRLYFDLLPSLLSPLQAARAAAPIECPQQLQQAGVVLAQCASSSVLLDEQHQQLEQRLFPKTVAAAAAALQRQQQQQQGWRSPVQKGATQKVKVALLLVGDATPGLSNVALGLIEKVAAAGGDVLGVLETRADRQSSAASLSSLLSFKDDFERQRNLSAFPLLGQTALDEQQLLGESGVLNKSVVSALDAIVILGGSLLGSCTLAEQLQQKGDSPCCVINVAGSSDFCETDPSWCFDKLRQAVSPWKPVFSAVSEKRRLLQPPLQDIFADASGVLRLGFDTQTKAAAELVGNLMADSNSAAKYYYFCRVGGGRGAEAEVALQTHPNLCLLSAASCGLTPTQLSQQIADCVEARSAAKKNFGVVLLNEDFFVSNKALCDVAVALATNGGDAPALDGPHAAIFASIPPAFQEKLCDIFGSPGSLPLKAAAFPILECLAEMTSKELQSRKTLGKCGGSFSPICFDLAEQVRGSFPSPYDCSLGYTLGLICGTLAVSPCLKQQASAAVVVSNSACASPTLWEPLVVPLTAAAIACGLCCVETGGAGGPPAVSLSKASAAGAFDMHLETPTQVAAKAIANEQVQKKDWLLQDIYLNCGPLQFGDTTCGAVDASRASNYLMSLRDKSCA